MVGVELPDVVGLLRLLFPPSLAWPVGAWLRLADELPLLRPTPFPPGASLTPQQGIPSTKGPGLRSRTLGLDIVQNQGSYQLHFRGTPHAELIERDN